MASRPPRGSALGVLSAKVSSTPKRPYMSVRVATLAPLDPTEYRTDKPKSQESSPMRSPGNSFPDLPEMEAVNQMEQAPVVATLEKEEEQDFVEKRDDRKRSVPVNRASIGFSSIAKLKNGTPSAPLIDSEVPGVISLAAAKQVLTSEVEFEKLPDLPEIGHPDFETIILKKLEICSEVLDFITPGIQLQEKEIKARALCELIEVFENTREVHKISRKVQEAIFRMLEANIFRQDPVYPASTFSVDCTISIIEPSWPHLFYCYQILNRFIQIFPNSDLINIDTAKTAIYLTQLPDTNERMQLVAFLRSYYDKHQEQRLLLLSAVKSQLQDIQDKTATPFCAMPLIIFLQHIYSRNQGDLNEPFKEVIQTVVFPLLGLPYMQVYVQNLRQLLSNIIHQNPEFTEMTFRALERMWPFTNANKQQYFIDILVFISMRLPQDTFRLYARRIFSFLAECVLSEHMKVVDAALDIWTKATVENWLGLNSRIAIHTMFDNISSVAEKCWSKPVKEKAQQALVEMCKLNKHTFHKMKMVQKQMKAQRYRQKIPNDCQRAWVSIAKAARDRGEVFDIRKKYDEFQKWFHNERHETLAPSRFVPVLQKDKDRAAKDAANPN